MSQIDLTIEKLRSLAALARELPPGRGGRPVHPGTLLRWSRRGIRGVKLETVRVGSRTCSSIEALHRFLAAVTVAGDGSESGAECEIPR